ncbi:protein mono-ADP-ribosyltransferase PARP14-like isoform X3 [Haliotis rufescens]|uniref:protein mono-ADP-ribosyltransferase PARP14-like isoform X3 n=1 Tax=Haliotis rufescens TaxID=6454 RepID=UPI00201EF590|nr:protein mono-ADP-ribosyltransferase PARP14-like isoform X3 [Haliotis rufescens]
MDNEAVETFPFSDRTEISFLKRVSIEGQLKDIHPDITINIDETQVRVKGSRNSVYDAKTFIATILEETELRDIKVTDPSRIKLFKKDVTRRYIGSRLLRNGLNAVYDVCEDGIRIRCKHAEFCRVRDVIDAAIVSEEVDALHIGVTLRDRLQELRDYTEVDDNPRRTRLSVHFEKYNTVKEIVDVVINELNEEPGVLRRRKSDSGFSDSDEDQVNGGGGAASQDDPLTHQEKSVYTERLEIRKPGIENIAKSDQFQAFLEETVHGKNIKVAPCHVNEEQGRIIIKQGTLEALEFKVDVLVCPASKTLDLSYGVVAKALSEAAGTELQEDCKKEFRVNEMKEYHMTVTPPYRLKCNNVLFVALHHWNHRQETKAKEMYQWILSECLEKISRIEPLPTSVALPALGCGNLGYPRDLVADLMMDTVKQFIQRQKVDVYVILHPDNPDVQKAFQARREAFHVEDIRLTVRKGDILEEQTDVIVNSISERFNLTETLSTELVERFGEPFKKDFRKNLPALQKSGLSFCKSCRPWTCVVHLCASVFKGKNGTDWLAAILSCLKESGEKFKPASVALPCLGVGSERLSPEQLAELLHDAIEQYRAAVHFKKHRINDIRLLVLRDEDFDRIVTTLQDIQERNNKRLEATGQKQVYDLYVSSTETSKVQDLAGQIRSFVDANVRSEAVEADRLVSAMSKERMDDLQQLARNHTVGLKVIGCKLILFGMDVDIAKAKVDIKRFLRTCHSAKWSSAKDDHNLDLDSINGYVEDAYQHNKRYTLFTDQSDRLYRLKIKDGKVSICQDPDKREIQLQRRVSVTYDDIPLNWSLQHQGVTDCVPVDRDGEEFKNVITRFETQRKSKSEKFHIKEVYRIENRLLHRKYKAEEERLSLQNGWDKVNERILWHGTSQGSVENINTNGFDRSYCGANAIRFGEGTYFSVDPSYSSSDTYSPPDSKGLKYVYQAKVLTGIPVEGKVTMKYLPVRAGTSTPYDSAVNNLKDIKTYVIFKDDQAYPEYLIEFTHAVGKQVDMTGSKTKADPCDAQDNNAPAMTRL